MKSALLPFLLVTNLLLLGVTPAAAQLLYEPFNYTPVGSDLTGKSPNGLNSWQSMGAAASDPIVISSGSLSISGLPSSGNSIVYGGLGYTNRIPLGITLNTGTLYYSFALQVTDLGQLDTTGGFLAGFNNATGSVTNQPTQIGARLIARATGTGAYQLGIHKQSTAAGDFLFDPTFRNVGETVFVVASYKFNSGTTTDDEAWLWINPDPANFGATIPPPPTLMGTIVGNDLVQIQSFLFRQATVTNVTPGAMIADELRVDPTWAGVTSIPEPSSLMLLSLAGSAALLTRRRNARR